jgi:hypothetical protein
MGRLPKSDSVKKPVLLGWNWKSRSALRPAATLANSGCDLRRQ